MRVVHLAAAAAVLPWLTAGVLTAVSAQAATARPARTYPNPACLVTTVPLYSPAMWQAAAGKKPEANVGVANWGSNTQNSAAGGPGKARNKADAAQISAAQADGTQILGYIATNYATGAAGYSTASVETQMTDWHAWYGITASTIMDWEDNIPPAKPPAWVFRYPANRFAMIMNAVPGTTSAIAAAVRDIEHAHAQAGFVTSDVSYQTLPNWSYWSTFAGDAAGAGCS